MKAQYVQVQTTDVTKINDEVARFAQAVGEVVAGRLIRVSLTSGVTNKVPHNLKSVPMGWFDGNRSAGVVPYNAQDPDASFLYLQVASDVTLTLWVF